MSKQSSKWLLVCVKNDEYQASLEKRKIYVALNDSHAKKHGLVRVVAESGYDHLYPINLFRSIKLRRSTKNAALGATETR
jgi:hypothetical protein